MDNIFEKIKHFEKVYLCDHQEFHEDHCLQLLQFSGLKEEKISIRSGLGLSVSKVLKVFGNCLHYWLSKVELALNYGQDIFNMITEISDMGNISE